MELTRCRLCLEVTDNYVQIFQETFPDMIHKLTGLKLEPEDGLPTTSCLQCHQEVKSAMLTRYQILNSHKILMDEFNVEKYVEKVLNRCADSTDNAKEVYLNEEATNINKNPQPDKGAHCQDLESVKNDDHVPRVGQAELELNTLDKSTKPKCELTKNLIPPKGKLSRQRTIRKTPNKDIKFRKKKIIRQKSIEDKIEFKRKIPGKALSIKVQYDIKPEHQEFLKNVNRKERVACPDCGRVLFGMNMKNHLITHNYDPVICDICGKTSKNAQALQDHINYYHKTTPDRYMCDKCGKGYRVRFMLERHEKKEHGNGEKDYECSICGKKFYEKLHLKTHINITHKKIKPYKCEYCGKDFGRRTQFVTHQLVHTKESRYHCQVCGKGFKIKQTMQTHLKGVHGIEEEKTIFCQICQRGFSSAQGLRAHVNSRVHGLEKCEHCSEFITVEYKTVHLRDIHGIKTDTSYS